MKLVKRWLVWHPTEWWSTLTTVKKDAIWHAEINDPYGRNWKQMQRDGWRATRIEIKDPTR